MSLVDRIKLIPIESVIEQYGIEVRSSGRNSKAICPFHPDTNPSLVIFKDKNSFYCFSCNKGGSVIDFVMLSENCDFRKSIEILRTKFGIANDGSGDYAPDQLDKVLSDSINPSTLRRQVQVAIQRVSTDINDKLRGIARRVDETLSLRSREMLEDGLPERMVFYDYADSSVKEYYLQIQLKWVLFDRVDEWLLQLSNLSRIEEFTVRVKEEVELKLSELTKMVWKVYSTKDLTWAL